LFHGGIYHCWSFGRGSYPVDQKNVEFYRSLKFVPIGTDALLSEGPHPLGNQQSADGQLFTVSATVTNLPAGTADGLATLKEITITAYPQVEDYDGWLKNDNLNTRVTLQRVRGNWNEAESPTVN
jgi:hypothetical protein